MDRLEAMRLFVLVAELGSFGKAAQQSDLSPSVVTRQIARLEAHLGVKLLARSTRHVSLTSAGADYLTRCREILGLVRKSEAEIGAERTLPSGTIRISLPMSFGIARLAPLLNDFSRHYPRVSLDMHLTDRHVNLVEERVDVAIRVTRALDANDVARKLATSRSVVVVAPEYLARRGRPGHPTDLQGHECLTYTGAATGAKWQFIVNNQVRSVPVNGHIQANNGDVLMQAATRGLGIACLPEFIVGRALAAGELVEILSDYAMPQIGIYAVLPSNRHIPQRIRLLMDFVGKRLAMAEVVGTGPSSSMASERKPPAISLTARS
jgi:DNA-binding transcriptional LysR family regulator